MANIQSKAELLTSIYGANTADTILKRLNTLITKFQTDDPPSNRNRLTHRDVILITYGDMVQDSGEPHLHTLNRFLSEQIKGLVNTVHILPFYPWSSDDGFSVIDYLAIAPPLGDWDDIAELRENFKLMFDAVINHISQESDWFQRFLKREEPYVNYFKEVDPAADLSAVFRPRALPLLTPVETADGTKHVWTTFSADQIDLNYESPDLLLEVMRVLLTYVQHGATLIRLDAIGFMWKVPGTRSLHLPETHAIIQLMRLVLDEVAPEVMLVTETNVPHAENISYFGNGYNEAQMVYNFSLPPLLMHAIHTGDATFLNSWAATLETPSDRTTFFNFCASHDGVGVTPARGILPDDEIEQMAKRVEALGGRVSYKTNSDGSQSAYELNISYLNGLGIPAVAESDGLKGKRFLLSQAIMLALRGVPGIYFHSLFGSENWEAGIDAWGYNRAINREKLPLARLNNELGNGLRNLVFSGYKRLLAARTRSEAFNPYGAQTIHQLHRSVVAIERTHGTETVLCLHNIAATPVSVPLLPSMRLGPVEDLLAEKNQPQIEIEDQIEMGPYQYLWFKKRKK